MITGTVSHYDRSRGFGWIIPSDGSEDVFFPFCEVNFPSEVTGRKRRLVKGQKVSYEIKLNERRPGTVMAGSITPLGGLKEPEPTPIPTAPSFNASDISLDNAEGAK